MPSETILVVDPERAIRALVQAVLETAGYTVLTAVGTESAMTLYKERQATIALVLTDVMMPDRNGLKLADEILRLNPQALVLFMSGNMRSPNRGFGCLSKPFTVAELLGRVKEALGSRQPSRDRKAATAA